MLNSLIGSQDVEKDFINLVNKYPEVIKAIPILLAKREKDIKIQDASGEFTFNFVKMNYSLEQYVLFMRNSGLFNLIQNHIIKDLVDYVLGVEVGMDINARKNRNGKALESLVKSYLLKVGLIENKTYFKQMQTSKLKRNFHLIYLV